MLTGFNGLKDYNSTTYYSTLSTINSALNCKYTYVLFIPNVKKHKNIPQDNWDKSYELTTSIATFCARLKFIGKVNGFYSFNLNRLTPNGENSSFNTRVESFNNEKFRSMIVEKSEEIKGGAKAITKLTVFNQGVTEDFSGDSFANRVLKGIDSISKANKKFVFDSESYKTNSSGSSSSETESNSNGNDNNAYVTSNDGKVKDTEHLFGDSGAPARYTMDGAKYYDVAVPYATTLKEIGGYATSATSTGKYHFTGSKSDWNNKQNGLFNIYNTSAGGLKKLASEYDNFGYDSSAGGLSYVMIGNVKCYCAAIGQGLFANSAWGLSVNEKGEPNWNPISDILNNGTPTSSGIFFDVLLKDGTQIHFIACDYIGIGHAVGGPETAQDKITYKKASMSSSQYRGMWHCDNPWQMVECSAKKGSSTKGIRSALGITDENPVMYIRVWDASLYKYGKKGITVITGMENGSSKGDALSTASGGNEEKKEVSEKYMKGMYDEKELSAWTKIINEYYINYKDITRDSLGQNDLNSLSDWEDNVNYDNLENHGVFHFFRVFFMVIGILMIIWAALLYCCYWFDRVNPFFEFSLVNIFTLGKLATAPTDEECNYTVKDFFKNNQGQAKYVNHKYIIVVCLSIIFFAMLIITGTIYKIVMSIISFVANLFEL